MASAGTGVMHQDFPPSPGVVALQMSLPGRMSRESLRGSLVFPNWELGGFLLPVFGAQQFLPLVHP